MTKSLKEFQQTRPEQYKFVEDNIITHDSHVLCVAPVKSGKREIAEIRMEIIRHL